MYAQKYTNAGDALFDQVDYLAEILENECTNETSSGERYFESGTTDAGAAKLLQTFSSFKMNTLNGIEKWNLELMVEDLEKHHGFLKENASIIYKEVQIVFYRHAENHPELKSLTEIIFLFLHDLLHQVRKEEAFFAEIKKIMKMKRHLLLPVYTGLNELKNTISLLQKNIDKSSKYLKLIRRLTLNYRIPADASEIYITLFGKLKRLEEDMTLHYHLEKKFLFPMVMELAEKKQNKIKVFKFLGF